MVGFNKPWYEIYFKMYCSGIIYVNDVPVVKNFGDRTNSGGLSGQMPLNSVILRSGKYNVKGVLLPKKQNKLLVEDDYMSIDFNVSDVNHWKETKQSFHERLESPESYFVADKNNESEYSNKLENSIENLLAYTIYTEIVADVPYKIIGWEDSVDLSKIEKKQLFKDVFSYYKMLYNVMNEHNSSLFIELSKEKELLQKTTLYLSDEKIEGIHNNIKSLFQEKLDPMPLEENDLKMDIFGGNKLVALSRLDGSSALQFKSPDLQKEENIELDIKLHLLNTKKGFSII